MQSIRCYATTGQVSRTEGGYLFPEDALRDTVAGWKADHETVSILRQGMTDLKSEMDSQSENLKSQLTELQKELAVERKDYKRQIKRGKVNGFLLGAVIGAVIGAVAASK